MIKAWFAFLAVTLAAAPALAETVRIRSGDHVEFSRLVIEFSERPEWSLGRVDGGYALRTDRRSISYDTSEVYRLISSERIAGLSEDRQSGWLKLDVTCNCHAVATEHRDSWVIIDVVNGPAPAGSPFEAALERPEPGGIAPRPRDPALARPRPEEPADTSPEMTDETELQAQAAAEQPVRRISVGLEPEGTGPVFLRPPAPLVSGQTEGPDLPGTLLNDTQLPVAEAVEDSQSDAISEQETALLEELARATAQGLLDADLPALDRIRESRAPETMPVTPLEPAKPEVAEPQSNVRVHAETSIDRDTGVNRPSQSVSPTGRACLPDDLFDFGRWGGTEDPAEGLTARRTGLVGEFDRPDPDAVLDLARYHLYLGFGAEAKATVAAFQNPTPETEVVRLLAEILDGETSGLPGILAGQSGCPGRAALWSAIAQGGPQQNEADNIPAILSAFSALPLHLRRHLGPPLAEQFLEAGDSETAVSLRNSIARAPGDHGGTFALLDARIDLDKGEPRAVAALETLTSDHNSVSAAAYAAYLETVLDYGRLPDNAAETASALAFEIEGTEAGTDLENLAVRSILASGDFEEARRELLRLEEKGRVDPGLWSSFAEAIAIGAQDTEFLRQVFAVRDRLSREHLPNAVAAEVSRRLLTLGFPEEALRYIPAPAEPDRPPDNESHLIRVQALLAADLPDAAYGELAGLNGPTADRLRAEALLALGDERGAAERFRVVGAEQEAVRSAWVGGAWDLLVENDNATVRGLAERRLENAERPRDTLMDSDLANDLSKPNHGERVEQAKQTLDDIRRARGLVESVLSADLSTMDPS